MDHYLERGPVGATCITGAPALRPPLRRSAERDLRAASFEIFDTQVLDFSIRPRRVHVIVRSQSDHTCNCQNFLFSLIRTFQLKKYMHNTIRNQRLHQIYENYFSTFVQLLHPTYLIMCIFLFTDSSLPRILYARLCAGRDTWRGREDEREGVKLFSREFGERSSRRWESRWFRVELKVWEGRRDKSWVWECVIWGCQPQKAGMGDRIGVFARQRTPGDTG